MKSSPVVIVGAGPAGLTAGYELLKHGVPSIVLEQSHQVGGISRTETYKGYRFDIGGHRFFTKVSEVQQIWKEILADDFIQVPRLSRIYYKGSYFDYPLSAKSTIQNLGIGQSASAGDGDAALVQGSERVGSGIGSSRSNTRIC